MRGATREWRCARSDGRVSIHAPHAGRDCVSDVCPLAHDSFNPRAHAGRDVVRASVAVPMSVFQSTRPMRGATHSVHGAESDRRVSIHAPHAGRDPNRSRPTDPRGVSIHAPHAGRDLRFFFGRRLYGSFNPRAPCGARRRPGDSASKGRCFNPRAPCGARLSLVTAPPESIAVSIHAPHAGRDFELFIPQRDEVIVSIHALHAGRDTRCSPILLWRSSFNPRAPCGARRSQGSHIS